MEVEALSFSVLWLGRTGVVEVKEKSLVVTVPDNFRNRCFIRKDLQHEFTACVCYMIHTVFQ